MNRLSLFSMGRLGLPPMTIRLMEYRPVMVTMPARMGCTPNLVCSSAVTAPASAPAASVALQAAPSTKVPSVDRSAMSSVR